MCVRSLGYIVGASPPPVKICVAVHWVTLWVRPPPCENMCVRSLGYIVGASPPCVSIQGQKMCVSVRWVTLWVRPPPVEICVSVRWVTLWVRPPPVILKTVPGPSLHNLSCAC